jgi:hypothetical protein
MRLFYRYSWDEGETWNTYTFHNETIRVYGVLTEPGEATSIFSIFGSHIGFHKWLIIQVNMENVFREFFFSKLITEKQAYINHFAICVLNILVIFADMSCVKMMCDSCF